MRLPESLSHPLPLFRKYLAEGYYPFAVEGNFARRMQQVVSLTVETDTPMYADMKAATAKKLKHMLAIIAQSAPYKPSVDHLAQEIRISKNNVPDYLLCKEADNGFVVKDDIEYKYGNVIPLFMFGLTY